MSVHPVQYTADEKKGADFGVMILYKLMASGMAEVKLTDKVFEEEG